MIIGPLTTINTYFLCHKSLRKPWWFIQYGLFSFFLYTDAKNICVRVSHLKEILGETGWRVTPRSAKDAVTAIEEKEADPEKIDIVPVGDAMLSFASLADVMRSKSGSLGSVGAISSDGAAQPSELKKSREDFSRQLEKSRSYRSFVLGSSRSGSLSMIDNLSVPDGAPVDAALPRQRSSLVRRFLNREEGALDEDNPHQDENFDGPVNRARNISSDGDHDPTSHRLHEQHRPARRSGDSSSGFRVHRHLSGTSMDSILETDPFPEPEVAGTSVARTDLDSVADASEVDDSSSDDATFVSERRSI